MHNSSTPRYSPDTDTHLGTFPHETGREEELYYSEEAGFYLRSAIQQIRSGRTWEAATLEDCALAAMQLCTPDSGDTIAGQHRTLETFRRMTREQVARKIIEEQMPEEDGLRGAVLAALFSSIGEARF